MTTTAPYEIETSEGDDGTPHPVEQLWTPCADDAPDSGFVAHRDLYVTGIDDATDAIEAAAAYMARVHGWRNLHLYPGGDPSVLIPRIRTRTTGAPVSGTTPGGWSGLPAPSPAPFRSPLCGTQPRW
ncbi:hypothetical protein [Streptomyces sp. NPDC051567]|uniref:hypothetical protein n=1 Tax=Streptomyces sp. NPDC051567 TaxID=3365660 RepID=UPI0037AB4D2B